MLAREDSDILPYHQHLSEGLGLDCHASIPGIALWASNFIQEILSVT